MVRRRHFGPIERLTHACEARRPLWFLCLYCGHAKRENPRSIIMAVGKDLTLRELGEKLRCRRCAKRGRAAVVVHDEEMPAR